MLRGDFGTDVVSGRRILPMVLEVLPYTLVLTLASIGIAVLLGVPLGCIAALRPGGAADRLIALGSVGFIAIPNFVIAIMLLLVFSTWLHWLPVLGTGRTGGVFDAGLRLDPAGLLARALLGGLHRAAAARLAARSAGRAACPHRARLRHRRAQDPRPLRAEACRAAGGRAARLGVGQMLGGAIFAEIVFARPGIGTLMFDAIGNRDFPVVQAAVLIVVALFTLANLLADALQARLDPRIAERERAG